MEEGVIGGLTSVFNFGPLLPKQQLHRMSLIARDAKEYDCRINVTKST